jgi:CheY-like chemotaxis protein
VAGSILLVEDDPLNRETLALLLGMAGFRVDTAADGAEALVRLADGAPPCLVLLDLTMPGVDGWEVLRRRREDPALATAPVVVVSALGGVHREALLALGARDVIQKPADPDELITLARRCCSLSAARVPVGTDPEDGGKWAAEDVLRFAPRGTRT